MLKRALLENAFLVCLSLALTAPRGHATETSAAVTSSKAPAHEITELSFKNFYKMPIGPRGLEPTPQLIKLSDHRVRVTGYMVREEEPSKGMFMLAPQPVSLAEVADGPADDLPGATLFVYMPPSDRDQVMPYLAGRWELAGVLELGPKEEPNGRISYTRLRLDESVKAASKGVSSAK